MARKKVAGRRGARSKSGVVRVDLSGIETRKTPAEDEYLVTVDSVEEKKGDKASFLAWVFKITEGKFEDSQLYLNTSLSEKSLWNLKTLLEALGVEIPDEAMDLDLKEMEGNELMVTVEHETFQGKKQARIVDFWEAGGSSGSKSDAPDFDEMDEDDLAQFVKKNKLDIDLDDFPKIKKARAAVEKAYEEVDSGKGKSGKNDPPDEDKVNEMDEDELAKVVKKFKLDVDLDDLGKIKKQRAAVIEALAGGEKTTSDEIKDMDEDELKDFVKEHSLDVNLKKLKSLRKMQAAVIEAGAEEGCVED